MTMRSRLVFALVMCLVLALGLQAATLAVARIKGLAHSHRPVETVLAMTRIFDEGGSHRQGPRWRGVDETVDPAADRAADPVADPVTDQIPDRVADRIPDHVAIDSRSVPMPSPVMPPPVRLHVHGPETGHHHGPADAFAPGGSRYALDVDLFVDLATIVYSIDHDDEDAQTAAWRRLALVHPDAAAPGSAGTVAKAPRRQPGAAQAWPVTSPDLPSLWRPPRA